MPPKPETLSDIVNILINLGLKIIPFLGAVAFLMFVFGVGRFIRASGNEKELKDSKNLLIWSIVGLFVLTTIWGIMSFIQNEFGFGTNVGIPQIKFKN